MKRFVALCFAFAFFSVGSAFAEKAKAQNVPEIPFDTVPNLIKLPPNLYLGEAMGVATNSKGHFFVFTRSANTRLFEFDQNGNYVREIGEGNYGFEFAHSVRVDAEDNIWAVDEGTNMVIKFNPQGRVVMVIGHRPDAVAGMLPSNLGPAPPAAKYTLGRPTDVTWDAQGNIFVSDGYVNNRVVKYDKNGRFVTQVGSEKAGNGPEQMNLPHGIAADAKGNLYVADRSNHRLQVYDNDLKFKSSYENIGDSWTTCVSPGPHQYLFTSNSNPNGNGPGTWETSGEIYKMELDGTIVGKFGHAGKLAPGFQVVHMMDCRNPNEIYVAEIESWRVQKLLLKPQQAKVAAK
ncbi:MAG TPA: peptidyl-alpha-hydroxyglycine alpha-amidating lyase family protein [Bryobacteraceae bacterium]|nr:peptidyl-alpha-hydroxyglycine alpha-amidating lyase family protein [Bryobacteraceae bacterium]